MSWKPDNHWSFKLWMLTVQQCCSSGSVCSTEPSAFQHVRNAHSLCALSSGTGVWGKLWPRLTSSPSSHILTFFRPAPCSDILSVFNTSSLHPALFFFPPMQLLLQHSWAMTGPRSFKHSLEEGSSRPSIRTEAKPSMRKCICLDE